MIRAVALLTDFGAADPYVAEMKAALLAEWARFPEPEPLPVMVDVSHAVQTVAESAGFSVVRDFVGHGIGRDMHEAPQIPNFGKPGQGPRLAAGMTLAIEPMVNLGGHGVRVLGDRWTVVTVDGRPSAHAEHTVAVGLDRAEILTVDE